MLNDFKVLVSWSRAAGLLADAYREEIAKRSYLGMYMNLREDQHLCLVQT